MIETRTISICLPTYNRYQMTLEAIDTVIGDSRVSEIVICDDTSIDGSYKKLVDHFTGNAKVRIFRNAANQDCYWNKRIAIEFASNPWCILLDSDNIIDTPYLDAIYAIPDWDSTTVYQPVYARPHFDFRQFSGITVDRSNLHQCIRNTTFQTALNAMNFFINRDTYLAAFDSSVAPHTSDSIFMAYRLLQQGNRYHFTPGMEYSHRIHDGSHYQQNNHKTGIFHQQTLDKLYNL